MSRRVRGAIYGLKASSFLISKLLGLASTYPSSEKHLTKSRLLSVVSLGCIPQNLEVLHKNFTHEFARLLREHRLTKGLSQERLAEIASIHPTHVGLIERGRRNPSIEVAYKLAAALGMNLSQLIKEAEEKSLPG